MYLRKTHTLKVHIFNSVKKTPICHPYAIMKNSRCANLVLYSNPAMPLLIVSKNPPDMLILVHYLPLTMPFLIVSKNSRYADFSAWIVIY